MNFSGNFEEALGYYAEVLGDKVAIRDRYDNPAMKAPEECHDKVVHASLEFGELTIVASDVIGSRTAPAGSGDAALSLDVSDPDEGKRTFTALAGGGKVNVPFEKQFWGAWHGNLRDRFGIRWMVNCR